MYLSSMRGILITEWWPALLAMVVTCCRMVPMSLNGPKGDEPIA